MTRVLTRRSVMQAGSVTSAYAIAQAINSAGAFVRVPLLVSAIGISDYGILLAVLSFWPWFSTMGDAARQTVRVWVAESKPSNSGIAVLNTVRRSIFVASSLVATTAVLVAMLTPLGKLAAPGTGAESGVRLAICFVGFVAALSLWPSVKTGWLEAKGKLVLTNLLSCTSTLVGLPCLIVALHFTHDLLKLSIVCAVGFAMPVVASLFLARNTKDDQTSVAPKDDRFNSTLRHMFLWSLAALAAYGFDTIIVGAVVGAPAAAEYGVAIRILGLATIVPLALGPTVMVRFASRRGSFDSVTPQTVCRVSGLFVLATTPLALATAAGGPALAEWLTHGQVAGRQSLYWLLAVTALLGAASGPIYAAFTAQRGLPVRNLVMILGSLVNVGLSFFLVVWLGTIGPALGSVVVAAIQLALLIMVMFRRPSLLGS